MGTWDKGILDNDTALDGLGDLRHGVAEDIQTFGAARPTATSTARLGGAVGVLLQLSAYDFGLDTETGPKIVTALSAHSAQIARLPTAARKVLEHVLAGEGKTLAERPAKMSMTQIAMLHVGGTRAPFGKREPSLFGARSAAAYVQQVARRCVASVDEDFEEEESWSDLCREGNGIGTLAALMVLEPCRVPITKINRWRRRASTGLALLEAAPDDELDFHRQYYANLDKVFAVLLRRYG